MPLLLFGTGRKKGGRKGERLHWRVQENTNSLTRVGSRQRVFEVLWNLEFVHFNEGNMAQFGQSSEKKLK